VFGLAGYGNTYVRQTLDGAIAGGTTGYHLDSSLRTSMFTWGFGGGARVHTTSNLFLDLGAEYRDAAGARVITPDRVSTAAGVVSYGDGSVDARQIIFRVGFVRAQ